LVVLYRVGNSSHQGAGSSSRILRFNKSNSNTTQNTYTMVDLDNLGCLTFSTITTPQQTQIQICKINLTRFSTNDNITINLTPYNNTNYYELLSTKIFGNTIINVSAGNNSYIVLGVAQSNTVNNLGTINLNPNAFLTNYFYYPQSTFISINNSGTINLNPGSIWYELTISIPLNSKGIVNGSYTETLPTSPSPPW
jgi:hypothetical protein